MDSERFLNRVCELTGFDRERAERTARAVFGLGELYEARFATGDLGAQATGVSYHRLKPNRRSAFAHKHEEAEEVYVVLAGAGRMKLDDEIVDIRPLDAIRVSPEVIRAF